MGPGFRWKGACSTLVRPSDRLSRGTCPLRWDERQGKLGLYEAELFLDDWRGVHIPRDFAEQVSRGRVSGVSPDQYATLLNPNNDLYWETWDEVCESATLTLDGRRYRLYQDGALWLIPLGMEWDDRLERFLWPVGTKLRVVRISDDLGLDIGTECTLAHVGESTMDLDVASLDTRIANVDIRHPALEVVQ
jgi:hypothetical protein